MIGDADYRTNTHYNRARFIARWGKIGEQIALLLRQSDPAWIFHNDSQPRIENTVKENTNYLYEREYCIGVS